MHEPKLHNKICDAHTLSYLAEIVKIAGPSSISSVLGQLTYLINFIIAGQTIEVWEIAGLGLGHTLSQFFGIIFLLGMNSDL